MVEVNGSIISNRAKAVIFILFALVLTGFGIEESLTDSERAAFMGMAPSISDMATSPVAQQIIKEGQNTATEEPVEPSEPEAPADEPTHAEAETPSGALAETASEAPTRVSTGALDGLDEVILIPKIGATLPIIEAQSYDLSELHTELDSGVVLYPASALFGQVGQTVLLGHSAPDNWPNIKHDTAFSRIDELAAGDKIVVYYHDKVYTYQVTRSEIIPKGGDLSGSPPAGHSLVLVSCWPPGRDQKRIAVEAVLLDEK